MFRIRSIVSERFDVPALPAHALTWYDLARQPLTPKSKPEHMHIPDISETLPSARGIWRSALEPSGQTAVL